MDQKYTAQAISYSLMVLIVAVNFIIRNLIIYLINWIGFETHSELSKKTTSWVFFGIFFNSGLLLVLTNANLHDVNEKLGIVFNGMYYDYSP